MVPRVEGVGAREHSLDDTRGARVGCSMSHHDGARRDCAQLLPPAAVDEHRRVGELRQRAQKERRQLLQQGPLRPPARHLERVVAGGRGDARDAVAGCGRGGGAERGAAARNQTCGGGCERGSLAHAPMSWRPWLSTCQTESSSCGQPHRLRLCSTASIGWEKSRCPSICRELTRAEVAQGGGGRMSPAALRACLTPPSSHAPHPPRRCASAPSHHRSAAPRMAQTRGASGSNPRPRGSRRRRGPCRRWRLRG